VERRRDLAQVLRGTPEAEAAYDDFALSLRQRGERRIELRELVVSRGVPRRVDSRAVGEHLVERPLERRPRARCPARLDDDVQRQSELVRDFERGRNVVAGGGELGLRAVDRAPPLDHALGQPDEPRPLRQRIANCTADLEPRIRLEVDAPRRVERLDRVEEADASFLDEVFERDVEAAVVRGDCPHGGKVPADEALACVSIVSRGHESRYVVCVHRYPLPTLVAPRMQRHRAELRISTQAAQKSLSSAGRGSPVLSACRPLSRRTATRDPSTLTATLDVHEAPPPLCESVLPAQVRSTTVPSP